LIQDFADVRRHIGWAKSGPQTDDHNSVNLYRFKKFTEKFLGKFVVKWIIKIPPHLAYVATLPLETLSVKHATDDKLQGSAAIYLRCGGVVYYPFNYKFTKESSSDFLKSVQI